MNRKVDDMICKTDVTVQSRMKVCDPKEICFSCTTKELSEVIQCITQDLPIPASALNDP